jgi:hypothetical protein
VHVVQTPVVQLGTALYQLGERESSKMAEGETSNLPSPVGSPPGMEMVNPEEEPEDGFKEIPELNFQDDNKTDFDMGPKDPDEFEDGISQGTMDTLAILKPGDVCMQPFDESCCLCQMTVKSGGRTLLLPQPAAIKVIASNT